MTENTRSKRGSHVQGPAVGRLPAGTGLCDWTGTAMPGQWGWNMKSAGKSDIAAERWCRSPQFLGTDYRGRQPPELAQRRAGERMRAREGGKKTTHGLREERETGRHKRERQRKIHREAETQIEKERKKPVEKGHIACEFTYRILQKGKTRETTNRSQSLWD